MRARSLPAMLAIIFLTSLAVVSCGSEDSSDDASSVLEELGAKFDDASAGSSEMDAGLVGVWIMADDATKSIELRADGTCYQTDGDLSFPYVYSVESGYITLSRSDEAFTEHFQQEQSVPYTLSGNTLTLAGTAYQREGTSQEASPQLDPALFGQWVASDGSGNTLDFSSGSLLVNSLLYTYWVEGNRIYVTSADNPDAGYLTYSVSGDTLTINDLNTYTRASSAAAPVESPEEEPYLDPDLEGQWLTGEDGGQGLVFYANGTVVDTYWDDAEGAVVAEDYTYRVENGQIIFIRSDDVELPGSAYSMSDGVLTIGTNTYYRAE